MKIIAAFSLTLVCFSSLSQDSLWTKVYLPDFPIWSEDAIVNADKDIVVGGRYQSDGLIFRTDSLGNLFWSETLPSVNVFKLENETDSTFLLAGSIYDFGSTTRYPLCAKFDSNGDTLWTRSFSVSGQTNCLRTSISMTADANWLFTWTNDLSNNVNCVKLDGNGNLIWEAIVNLDDTYVITDIEGAQDSSIYICGYVPNLPGSGSKSFLMKLQPNGTVDWSQVYTQHMIMDLSIGNGLIYGLSKYFGSGGSIALLMIDSQATVQLGVEYLAYLDMPIEDRIRLMIQSNGNLIISNQSQIGSDFYEIDAAGNIVNVGNTLMVLNCVLEANNDGLYLVGNGPLWGIKSLTEHIGIYRSDSNFIDGECTQPVSPINYLNLPITSPPMSITNNTGINFISLAPVINPYFLIVEEGCVDQTGSIEEYEQEQILVYPNQTSGPITIEFESFKEAHIDIVNSMGAVILQKKFKGISISMDLSEFNGGLYFYRIKDLDSDKIYSGQIILN